MLLVNAALSAVLNVVVLAVLPWLGYYLYLRRRHRLGLRETLRRSGLQLGPSRFLAYSAAFGLVAIAVFAVAAPPVEPFLRVGSPQRAFEGLGLSGPAIPMALLYGVVQTGFAEELLFRGLIAGSLARRTSTRRANGIQALIFLLPHVLVLTIMPEMWPLLPLVFAGALFVGWVRIRSGSILGPWLVHAALNVTTCLSIAARTATS